jgi:single-strand DNA-binding protein
MINKVILVGRLGKDPEVKHLENGAVVANFSVATSENYKDRDGNWQERTEWHKVAVWRQAAERAEKQLRKGSLVYIEGKLTTRSWEDKDGNKKYSTEVVADIFRALDRKREDSAAAADEPELATDTITNDEVKDDLPF